MDCRIGGVVELRQDEAVRRLAKKFICLGNCALHPVGAGGQHDLRAKCEQQYAALQAHGLGHGEDEAIALDGRDECETDARVAAGGLDQRRLAGGDLASLLGRFNHGQTDTVFNAAQGVLAFQFGNNGRGQACGHAIEPHKRGLANKFRYIRGNARHGDLLLGALGPVRKLLWDAVTPSGGGIRARAGARQRRSCHQSGVSDIDACKQVRPEVGDVASGVLAP